VDLSSNGTYYRHRGDNNFKRLGKEKAVVLSVGDEVQLGGRDGVPLPDGTQPLVPWYRLAVVPAEVELTAGPRPASATVPQAPKSGNGVAQPGEGKDNAVKPCVHCKKHAAENVALREEQRKKSRDIEALQKAKQELQDADATRTEVRSFCMQFCDTSS
jgi:hypothetical protein